MKTVSLSRTLLAAAALGVTLNTGSARAQVSFAGSYTQNFDTLANSGTTNTFTDNTTLLGWYAFRTATGPSATTPLLVGAGVDTAGGLYSFGAANSTERALGSIGSGNAAVGSVLYGVQLQNTSGGVIDSLTVNYTGEQWRNGGNTTAQTLSFAYFNALSNSANQISGNAYTSVAALGFTTTVNTAFAGPLDGNVNSTAKASTITGLNWQSGQYVWLRWTDANDPGNDHALAVDNISLSATVTPPGGGGGGVAPEPGTMAFLLPVLPILGGLLRRRKG